METAGKTKSSVWTTFLYAGKSTKKSVYFLADIPYLLKLLRNWFLDTGFILRDTTVITKDPVKVLINSTRSEINSCYKLTPHLACERAQRQNLKLAAPVTVQYNSHCFKALFTRR